MPACCPSHCCFLPSHWSAQNAGQARLASDWSAQSCQLLIGPATPHPTDWKCKNAQKSNRAASGGWDRARPTRCRRDHRNWFGGGHARCGVGGHGGDGAKEGVCLGRRETEKERQCAREKRCTLLCSPMMAKKCVFHARHSRTSSSATRKYSQRPPLPPCHTLLSHTL